MCSNRVSDLNEEGNVREPSPGRQRATVWLSLLVIAAIAAIWLGLSLRRIQSSYPGVSPTVPLAVEKSYGVNADLTRLSPEELDRALTRMSDLGLRWIRQPFAWVEIEPAPGQFNWAPWDQAVAAADAHDLKLIAVLDTTPAWARPPDTDQSTPPTELIDFGNFSRALAERYGDQLDYYQIWEEPNLSAHWGNSFVDPRSYARLLREGAINLRAVDQNAVVLTAALAPTVETGPLNLNEPAFLAGLYAANAAPWFDVVAAQPYGFEHEPTAPPREEDLNFARPDLLRQVMVAHDDGHKPIWATAFGWSALPQAQAEGPSPWPSVSSEQQGAYTTQAIHHARANWPWMGPMVFAAWDAELLPDDDARRGLALVAGEDHLPQTQSLGTHQVHNAQSGLPGEESAAVGTYPAYHRSGSYSGDWRLSLDGADVPRHPPATLTIPFDGTRLDLMLRRGAFRGFLYVTIDGMPANALPQHDGRAYVVLYDPLEQEDIVTLARFLPDGPHTAQVEAEGGWYQWPVVGWRVSREGDTRAIWLGLILACGLGIVAAVGLVSSTRSLPLPYLRRQLETLQAGYLALGTPVHLAILAGTGLAFFLAPGTLVSLGLLSILFIALFPRPDLGLTLIAFSLPFFLLPKSLVGRTIAMTEVVLILVGLVCVARRTLTLLSKSTVKISWLDWCTWLLTTIAILAGLLTFIPVADTGLLVTADWPVLTLMLIPLAGVLAAISQMSELAAANNHSPLLVADSPASARWPTRSLDLAVMALVALALLATLAAKSFGISLREFHVVIWDGAAFYTFVRLIPSLDLTYQAQEPDAERLAWSVVDAFLLGTTLMALYAIYQFIFTDQAITAEGVHRALGLYGSPNNLALLLDRAAPIIIAVVAMPRLASAEQSGVSGGPMRRPPG